MPADTANPPATPDRDYTITRVLDAPRALVFAAWTQPTHLTHWLVPAGSPPRWPPSPWTCAPAATGGR